MVRRFDEKIRKWVDIFYRNFKAFRVFRAFGAFRQAILRKFWDRQKIAGAL